MRRPRLIIGLLSLSLLLGSIGCGAGSFVGSTSETSSTLLSGAGNKGLAPGLPPLATPDPGEPTDLLSYMAIRLPMHSAYGVPQDHFSMTAEDFSKLLTAFQDRLDADKSDTVWQVASDFESRLGIDFMVIGRPRLEPATSVGTFGCDFLFRVYDAGKDGKKVDTSFTSFANLEHDIISNQYPNLVTNAGLQWLDALVGIHSQERLFFRCEHPMPEPFRAAI